MRRLGGRRPVIFCCLLDNNRLTTAEVKCSIGYMFVSTLQPACGWGDGCGSCLGVLDARSPQWAAGELSVAGKGDVPGARCRKQMASKRKRNSGEFGTLLAVKPLPMVGCLCVVIAATGHAAPTNEQTAPVSARWTADEASTAPSAAPAGGPSETNSSVILPPVTVTAELDRARDQIAPSSALSPTRLAPTRSNPCLKGKTRPSARFCCVRRGGRGFLWRSACARRTRRSDLSDQRRAAPGGSQRLGQEIDTRLINSVTLITGTLPAQFGFRTAGIVDVSTKNGSQLNGGEVSFYGGGYDTINPSGQFGGTSGKVDYFVTASYLHDDIGIENPTSSYYPIHDTTEQEKLFTYLSYQIDDSSRLSLLLNGSYANFQLPNTRACRGNITSRELRRQTPPT